MKTTRIAGLILSLFGTVGLVVSLWPISRISTSIPFNNPIGADGTLQLIEPAYLRVGNSSDLRLTIDIHQGTDETNPLTLLSKLEMDNLDVTPRGEGKVTVDPAKLVTLNWQITSHKSGIYKGTLWLFLINNAGEKELILAKPIELHASPILGFSYKTARIFFITGLTFGTVLLFCSIFNQKRST